MRNDIQIYVADLAAYNAGYLHGVWIDATLAVDDMQEAIQSMLTSSPVSNAEEYAIHDYEGFEGVSLSEWEGLQSVHQIATFIDEHGPLAAKLLEHYDLDQAKTALEDNYHGCYSSLADYAEQFTSDTSEVPQHLQAYIDYERMAQDWEMSGDIFTVETAHDEVHVFSPC
ncbi:antirestriction protein ArdA [Pseudoalteromonas sp. JC28]|uniref:antirestriction protein ArdA n=1 Tax=Pseudoalteromonas sp. JC28 TaxID=2267617 RepID=UPI0015725E0E|nr:antirestriction protein ArdA [Pseudoalteromonas sp. JC28]NSY32258.1 antirestriction protein ArdA [Pseudoalteromonas sp. JC28]